MSKGQMQYGRILDYIRDGDRAVQTITYFRGGEEMDEHRRTVIENKRVESALEEAAEYHAFAKRYHQDPTMHDPIFAVNGKSQWAKGEKDYYYAVLTYTEVVDGAI